uniref:Uncharacterized protein n=1 Tax=Arundo donax TaxID=35708 RepID=A0A0A9BE28_ARUDO
MKQTLARMMPSSAPVWRLAILTGWDPVLLLSESDEGTFGLVCTLVA